MLSQKELLVEDIVLISTGDKIPADGRLLESSGLAADEASLTGESVSAKKSANYLISDVKTPLVECADMLYSGNYITSAYGKMMVTAVGDCTEFRKIAKELSGTEHNSTTLQEELALQDYAKATGYTLPVNRTATAQGWALNDAGQFFYYKDGKALTGIQTIDGVTYDLNTDGAMKTASEVIQ